MEVEEDDDKEDEKHLQIKEGWHCRSSPLLHNDDYNDDDDNDGSYYARSGHLPMRWGAIDAPRTKTTMTTLPRRVSPRRENKDAVSDLPGSAVAPPSKPMVMTPPREKGPRRRRRRTTRDAARLQGFIVISARPTCLNIAGTIVTQHLHPNQQHMHHHPALPRSLSANPESQMTAIKAAMNAPASRPWMMQKKRVEAQCMCHNFVRRHLHHSCSSTLSLSDTVAGKSPLAIPDIGPLKLGLPSRQRSPKHVHPTRPAGPAQSIMMWPTLLFWMKRMDYFTMAGDSISSSPTKIVVGRLLIGDGRIH